jgi:hypothetical protein
MTVPKERRVPWFSYLFLAGFLFLVVAAFFDRTCRPSREGLQRVRARNEAATIVMAVRAYLLDYDSLPAGDGVQIMNALRGNNPKKTIFFEARLDRYNARGEYLDEWGTPFRIDVSDPDQPRAYSCGKNTRDEGGAEGSDDIPSWR